MLADSVFWTVIHFIQLALLKTLRENKDVRVNLNMENITDFPRLCTILHEFSSTSIFSCKVVTLLETVLLFQKKKIDLDKSKARQFDAHKLRNKARHGYRNGLFRFFYKKYFLCYFKLELHQCNCLVFKFNIYLNLKIVYQTTRYFSREHRIRISEWSWTEIMTKSQMHFKTSAELISRI